MLHKRIKSCLCAALAAACLLSSIPVQAQPRAATYVNVAQGCAYTSTATRFYDEGPDPDGSKLTDGQKGSGDFNEAYVGYKFQNGEVTETDMQWDWRIDLNGLKDIHEIKFSGWSYHDNYIYHPKFYSFYYTDENGEEQPFYLFPKDEQPGGTGALEHPHGNYEYSYALPNEETVKASSVRVELQPFSVGLFLDEIQVMGIDDGSGSTDLPAPPAENLQNISSGLKYTTNYTSEDFIPDYEDPTFTKLTNNIAASGLQDSANNAGFAVQASKPLALTFKLRESKLFRGLTLCGWTASDNPQYTVEYRNPDGLWTQFASGTMENTGGRYVTNAFIAGDNAATTDELRVTLTVSQDTSVYLDEIIAYEVKQGEPSTIDPNNIIGGLTYKTNLKDGDANKGEGDFHIDHADVGRSRLTDGKKAPDHSTWGHENVVGLHSPVPKVPHDDPDEKRVIMEFNMEEAQSFRQVSFNAFAESVSGIVFPVHLLVEYQDTDDSWNTLFDRDLAAPARNMYNFSYLVPENGSITAKGVRFSFSIKNNQGWLFIDELEVLKEATTKLPTINPEASLCHNLLESIPYETSLKDGDANKGEGNFHGEHPDLQRKLLTDGLYSSGYSDPNGLYLNRLDDAYAIPADITFDLGETKTFEQINISTVGNEYICIPGKAVVKISDDKENWTQIYSASWTSEPNNKSKEFILTAIKDEPITARYLSFDFYYQSSWQGLDEIQVYDQATGDASDGTLTLKQPPLDALRGVAPTISEDGASIVLPASPSEYFDVELLGSDNLSVIDLDGNIHTPLIDTTVNLIYKAVNKETGEIVQGDYNVSLTVPGQYQPGAGDNKKPDTMPALREWKGSTGNFTLLDSSAIVVNASADSRTKEIANQIKAFFQDMLGRTIPVKEGTPSAGDICLTLDSSLSDMGEEGYYMDIGDTVTISASGHTGLLYGGVSVTQILYNDPQHQSIPKGEARDYPMYSVRGGMVDVARAYIPMEYLTEITRYMAWFKLNEIHVHINDRGDNNYAAFRLESDIPNLTSKDGYYTKNEYRAYQQDALKYGIKVVTEFDTPGHSNCFANVPGIKMLDASHIDITDAGSVQVIKDMFTEYLSGSNPVLITDTVHIGTDEFPYRSNKGAAIRQYTYDIANHVKSFGLIPRFWGGYWDNSGLPDGVTSNPGVQANFWAHDTPSVDDMYDMGYDIVNTYNMLMYSVPGGNYGFANYYNLSNLYTNWNPNWFDLRGAKQKPLGHPQTLGAEFAVWNDVHTAGGGTSYFDVFQRVKYGVMLVAEKDWQGAPTEGQNFSEFTRRMNAFWNKVPGANPNRYVESNKGKIASYDFESVSGTTVSDRSGNAYNGTLHSASISEDNGGHAVSFDGNGYLSLPMNSVGYPFTVELDIKLTDNSSLESTLFTGKDGTFYTNVDGKGNFGFKRDGYVLKDGAAFFDPEGYAYSFDYVLPLNKWVHLKIYSESNNTHNETYLVVDGREYKAKMLNSIVQNTSLTPTQYSTTTILPTEKIGYKMKGAIDNLSIFDSANASSGPAAPANLALYADVSVSSREVEDRFGPELAVDGDRTSEPSRVSFGRTDDQWLIVDLGKLQNIDRVVLYPFEQSPEFEILISATGQDGDWKQIYSYQSDTDGGEREQVHTADFDPTRARYVKYHQLRMWTHPSWGKYSGSISEIEVYRMAGEYDVVINAGTGGKVTADRISANAGDTITLTITPDVDYTLQSITVNGSSISPVNGVYSFTMPEGNATVEATFKPVESKPSYNINIATTANGTVTADRQTALEGDKVTLTIRPADGYVLDKVMVNGNAITASDGQYSFVMPAADVEITAFFKSTGSEPVYNITITKTSGGSVSCEKTSATVGETIRLSITPNQYYRLDSLWYNEEEIIPRNGFYSFVMPAEDVVVTAYFVYSGSSSGGGGSGGGSSVSKPDVTIGAWKELPDGSKQYIENNKPVTGWKTIQSKRYCFNSEGKMLTGWFKDGANWYYLGDDGVMQTGWRQVGGSWYYLKGNGTMATGWIQLGNTWYYLKSSGAMQTGWLNDSGSWYWLESWGGMANSNWVQVGNLWYYFRGNGRMMTGWLQQGSTWYYLKSSGAMQTGWSWIGSDCYYFASNGAMAANTTVNGYRLNQNGAWVK